MKTCSIRGCNGVYVKKSIVRTFKKGDSIVVIDNIPADVCSLCGDTLISIDVSEQIETMLKQSNEPKFMAPVYSMHQNIHYCFSS